MSPHLLDLAVQPLPVVRLLAGRFEPTEMPPHRDPLGSKQSPSEHGSKHLNEGMLMGNTASVNGLFLASNGGNWPLSLSEFDRRPPFAVISSLRAIPVMMFRAALVKVAVSTAMERGNDIGMNLLQFDVAVLGISVVAGGLGSLLGLGGGIIIIPVLTLLFHIDIRYAIGASIVSVIATSSGAAAAYVRERMTNLRVAMVLELATSAGALTGAYLAGQLAVRWLYVIFGIVMGYSALMMFRKRHEALDEFAVHAPWADYLRLHSSYYDERAGREIFYRVVRTRVGLMLMSTSSAWIFCHRGSATLHSCFKTTRFTLI